MSSPEPTPLAQRLVDIACEAVLNEQDIARAGASWGGSYDLRSYMEAEQRAAVAAVLRELATDTEYMRLDQDGHWLSLARIRSLADSIEKGGEAHGD